MRSPARTLARTLGRALAAVVAAASLLAPVRSSAQGTIDPFYAPSYTLFDLGSVPGVPPLYGGINFAMTPGGIDYNTLIIGGFANEAPGQLFQVPVIRGPGQHITGFGAPATFYADAAYNDGGVTYGPGNVLFLARWPQNEMGQTRPGSSVTDKIVNLAPFVAESPGGLTFVPNGQPGAGQLKLVSWPTGMFYTLQIAPDGTGLYDVTGATLETTIQGGPEGFVYVPAGSPQFAAPSMLVSEFDAGIVSSYLVDANGNPIPGSRQVFISGLTGAEGALIDPLSGDFLFSTFGGGDRLVRVQGFVATVPEPSTVVLSGTGLLALAAVAWRRRRTSV